MANRSIAAIGAVVSFVMVLAALWLWQNAAELTYAFDRPDAAASAVKIGAVGLAAGAQVVIATLVLARIYHRDVWTRAYGFGAAVALLMSLTSAVIVAVAGR